MSLRRTSVLSGALLAVALLSGSILPDDRALLDAAKRGDAAAVKSLLKEGVNPNAAQGDGLTALHIAAAQGSLDVVKVLIGAKANVDAKTKIGEYTPLHVAAEAAQGAVVKALLDAGADPKLATTNTGVTALHLAAKAVNGELAVKELVEHGAPINAREASAGQTPLMFAASYGRVGAIRELMAHGADAAAATQVVDVLRSMAVDKAAKKALKDALVEVRKEVGATDRALTAEEEHKAIEMQRAFLANQEEVKKVLESFKVDDLALESPLWLHPFCRGDAGQTAAERAAGAAKSGCTDDLKSPVQIKWRPIWETLVGKTGGMTALLHATREGQIEAAKALLDGGADINQGSGDGTTPLTEAVLNGHFDLAMMLIQRGADVNKAADTDGVTPVFAVINTRWFNYTDQPGPRAQDVQQTDYLQVLDALLQKGADPNVRLKTQLWYWEYAMQQGGNGGGDMGLDITGATPFWRAAIADDVDAMKMLVAHGADATIPTKWPEIGMRNGRQSDGRIQDDSGIPREEGSPNMYPINAAAGGGFLGLSGAEVGRKPGKQMLSAVKYLVEELGADVNQADSWGYTPLHYAAGAAANDLVEYLVSKGANVNAISVLGQSPIDFTRGGNAGYFSRPPYPETYKLLESLGGKALCFNTHFRGTGDYCPTSNLKPWGAMERSGADKPTPVK